MSPADTLERDLARTLTAKADQLDVADPPPTFRLDVRPPATVVHLTPHRSRRQRTAVAAAAAVAVLALAGARVIVGHDTRPDVAMGDQAPVAARYGAPGDGPVGFLPATVPAGWALSTIEAATSAFGAVPHHWQLFGADDAVPLTRGVLVATSDDDGRVVPTPNAVVHGVPAAVGPTPDPSHPAGALSVQWIEGDIAHDAIAVGMGADELVAFVDGLTVRADPTAGFDAAGPAGLREVGSATVAATWGSSVSYQGPDGSAATVRITSSSSDPYGGLLHRFDGAPGADGWASVRRGPFSGLGAGALFAVRPDGWSVEVGGAGSEPVDPTILDAFLGALRPTSSSGLVDLARAQPVTARYEVGERTVEVHGTPSEDVGVCVGSAGTALVCATAEAVGGDSRITAASLVVDGRWLLVTFTGDRRADVQTAPADPARWQEYDAVVLEPGARGSGPGVDVDLYDVPSDAEAVEAVVMAGDYGVGFSYDNPLG